MPTLGDHKMTTEAKVGAFVIASVLVLGSGAYFVRTTQTVRGQHQGGPGDRHAALVRGSDPNRNLICGKDWNSAEPEVHGTRRQPESDDGSGAHDFDRQQRSPAPGGG